MLVAPANAQTSLCPHYNGYINVEGKYGSQRHLGETSLFLPLSCSTDRLLFSDIRTKLDNKGNREGNFGVGIRFLQPKGIVGSYAYFDRKKSGNSGKYFSQATAGAEWLAEDWEVRANGYVPLSEKMEQTISPSSLSDPFLAGSGIFAQETAGQILREVPLYGGDIEAGFKIPDTNFWLHAGAFSFNAEESPSLDGVRGRATWQVTDNFALTAEGQYDDERGQQGWVGVRFTIPLGKAEKPNRRLAARMTASPVRDVDIVTTTKTEQSGTDRLVQIENAESGNVQRVLYVDNSQAINGDGTLENPYNNLADAETQLQDHDVLYIAHGTGDNTRMQQGLDISSNGVEVIGEGSSFVYDGSRFTFQNANFTGTVLRAAGNKPVLGNINPGTNIIDISGSNVTIAGLRLENADQHGIQVLSSTGNSLSGIQIDNVSVSGSGEDGIRIEASGAGSSIDAILKNIQTNGNTNGVRYYATSDASVSGALESVITTTNNQHGLILYDDSTAGAVDVDLGGDSRSLGNNALYGNVMEDLAIDIDGGTLSAQNNWWGLAAGLYQSAPSGGNSPQIYFGAPVNEGLVGHWTLDSEWMNGATVYDRSLSVAHGALLGALLPADAIVGNDGEAMLLNSGDYMRMTGIDANNMDRYTIMGSVRPVTTTGGSGDQITFGYSFLSDGRVGAGLYGAWVSLRNSEVVARTFNPNNAGHVTTGAAIANGVWTDIAITSVKGANSQIFINGTGFAPFANPGTSANWTTGELVVGDLRPGRNIFFNGGVDDLRVYNRILTASEIAQINRQNTSSVVDSGNHRTNAP